MLKTVYLKNFKCYGAEGVTFRLAPLTFLYGDNSAGKSTFLQSVSVLGKTTMSAVGFSSIVHKRDNKAEMQIGSELSDEAGSIKQLKTFKLNEMGEVILELKGQEIGAFTYAHVEALRPPTGLGAVSSLVDGSLLSLQNIPTDKVTRMLEALGFEYEQKDSETLKDKAFDLNVALPDVGAGIHHLVKNVLQPLAMLKPGGTLLLEEPETHLHPRYLGKLTKLLIDTQQENPGSQIIVECHSEHNILALQAYLSQKVIAPKDVSVIHIARDPEGSRLTRIPFDKDGRMLQDWPGGFFDERGELICMRW